MSYKYIFTVLLIMLLLSACSREPVTDTIIIPDTNQTPLENSSSKPVQVKTIYRVPDYFSNIGRILGWSAQNAIIASFNSSEKVRLEQLPYPFENAKAVDSIDRVSYDSVVSPDGKYMCEISFLPDQTIVQLLSIQDGKKTLVSKWSDSTAYIQNVSWSANSQYISYLVNRSSDREQKGLNSTVHIYNMSTQKDNSYQLSGFQQKDTLIRADVANNGTSVLLQSYQTQHEQKKVVTMTEVSGNTLDIQYEREISGDHVSWINNDQFVFPGSDGSLYEYDRRNGELSVILDHVLSFAFSNDCKNIAYTSLQDPNIIYVGKIQGRNILHQEAVYRGISASALYWSPNGKRLLIQGAKPWDTAQSSSASNYSEEALIVELES